MSQEDLPRLRRLEKRDAEINWVFAAIGAGFEGVSEEEIERELFNALEEVDAGRTARRARGEVV